MNLSTTSLASCSPLSAACTHASSDYSLENWLENGDSGARGLGRKPQDSRKGYACPFFKNDPSKYDRHKTRLCAESSWANVSRLKEHLTRAHTAKHYCSRCYQEFEKLVELHKHTQMMICRPIPGRPPEGIRPEVVGKLRSRKKYSRHQSQEDKWTEIYQMLFPGREVPSPYFEHRADRSLTPNLDEFENDLRQKVSRRVSQVLDEHMPMSFDKNALLEKIDEVHKDVFNNYRTSSRSEVVTTTGLPSNCSSPLLMLGTKTETETDGGVETLLSDFGSTIGCSYQYLDQEEWNHSHSTSFDATASDTAWWMTNVDVDWDKFTTNVGEVEKTLSVE